MKILKHTSLSRNKSLKITFSPVDDKKNALNTWEQDERQLLTASNEGMSGSDEGLRVDNDNRLGEVVRAKGEIGEKPKHKPSH